MYNRYIPQNDGSYRRSRIPDPPPGKPPVPAPEPPCPPSFQPQEIPRPCPPPRPQPRHGREQKEPGITAFLRQLLPRDLDSGDLLVIILLLLISSDCREEQNTALLTLALYLFL